MFPKSPNNRLKRRQLESIEIPAGHRESIERAQKMIRRAHDRFRREFVPIRFLFRRFTQNFVRRDSEKQSQMLAQRQRAISLARKKVAEPARSDEMNAEMRLAFLQQTDF